MARPAEGEARTPARFSTPEAVVRTLAAALEQNRLGAALALFAEGSCLVTPDSTAVTGRAAIGKVLAQLIQQRVRIEIEPSGALVGADVAFLSQRWRLSVGRDPSNRHSQETIPILVLRRVGAQWKLAVAAPWGC